MRGGAQAGGGQQGAGTWPAMDTRAQGGYRERERGATKRKRVTSGEGRQGETHSGQPDSGTSVTSAGRGEPRRVASGAVPAAHWFKMRNSGWPPRRIGTAGKRGNAPLARETLQTRPLCILAAGGKAAQRLYSDASLQMDGLVCTCGQYSDDVAATARASRFGVAPRVCPAQGAWCVQSLLVVQVSAARRVVPPALAPSASIVVASLAVAGSPATSGRWQLPVLVLWACSGPPLLRFLVSVAGSVHDRPPGGDRGGSRRAVPAACLCRRRRGGVNAARAPHPTDHGQRL